MKIIAGKDGPKTDLVAVNAGAALYIYGLASSIKEGYHIAKSVIHGGKAKGILDEFILLSNS